MTSVLALCCAGLLALATACNSTTAPIDCHFWVDSTDWIAGRQYSDGTRDTLVVTRIAVLHWDNTTLCNARYGR